MTTPDPTTCTTITDPTDVTATLASLDLTADVLTDAANAGEHAARAASTKAHPRTAAGYARWSETVATARSTLADHGWRIDDPRNRPLSIHPENPGLALAFASGDSSTGNPNAMPNVMRRKGPATTDAYPQLTIPFGLPSPAASGPWIFLYYRDDEELRMELSMPTGFTDGVADGWHQRIILPAMTFDAATPTPRDIGTTDVEFIITPRDA